jgi:iron(III) transport system substrate-binding protein
MLARTATLAAAAALVALAPVAFAADEPTAEVKKYLAEEKLDPAIMKGLDKELALPASLVAAAKKEGKFKIRLQMSEKEFQGLEKAFAARYPGFEIEYTRGIGRERAIAPLVAFKAGNYVTDVVSAYDSAIDDYRAADALERIDDLPAYNNLWPEMQTKERTDAADKLNNWCVGYAKDRVKESELPKSWDDIVNNPRWKGKIGVYNVSESWVPPLYAVYGEKWTQQWLHKLAIDQKAQFRKETLAATSKLLTVGEFDIFTAMMDYIVDRDARKGVPVGAQCLEPYPVTAGYVGIFKGSPHKNAAKLFINWYLSKEGQVAAFHHARAIPVHRDFKTVRGFVPYPDEVIGKKSSFRTTEVLATAPKVAEMFRKAFEEAGAKTN